MSGDASKTKRVGRWYFGGLASAGAACCTHPLDLIKVHLQTAGTEKKVNVFKQVSDEILLIFFS